MGQQAADSIRLGLTATGLKAPTSTLAATGLLSGGINAGFAGLTGGNVAQSFGRGLTDAPVFTGVNRLSSFAVNPLLSKTSNLPFQSKLAIRAPILGGINVAEDALESFSRGDNFTFNDALLSGTIGAIASPLARTDGLKGRQGALKQRKQGDVIKKLTDKLNTPKKISKLENKTFKSVNDLRQELGLNRNEFTNASAGAFAGIEITQDEDGNYKFNFNPAKAGLGIAFAGGVQAIKPKLKVGGGKFGTERFNVNETLENTIKNTAKRLEPEIAIKRGGTKSFEQTLSDAKKISLDDLLSGKGNQPTDARVFAASAYIKDLSETIDSIRAKGPAVLPDDRAVLENAQENLDKLIIKTFGELSPESGRALKAHQYLAEVITDPQLKLKNFVARNTDLYPNSEKVVSGLNQFKPEDKIGMIKYLRDAQKVDNVSKLESIWYNNILSGTSTHLANLVGNLGRTMWHLSTKPARVGVDTLGSAVTGQPRQEFLKETMPELVGATKGFRDGVRRAVFAFKNGLRESDVAELNVPKSAFKGRLQAIETPGRLLLAGDELFRGINRNMDIYRQAASTAAQEGLKGDAYNIRVAELIDSPTSDMLKKADDLATKLLFQDASKELSAVGGLRDFAQFDVAKLGTVRPMRFVIPFIQTPVNVAKFAVEASPLGLAQTALGAKNLSKQELNRQLASNLMGTAMTAALATYFVEGNLTARAPSGKEGDAFYEEGKLPYSVKIGDTWVQYNRLPEPLASQLTNLALLHEQFKDNPDADIAQKVGTYTSGFIRSMADRTFLSGIGDLMDAIEDPERYGKRFTQNLATGFIPGSSFVGSVARATDRTVRNPENLGQALQSRVPGLSQNVPARTSDIAASGEATRRSPAFQEFLPFKTSKETAIQPEQFANLSSKGIVERLPNLDVDQRIQVLANIKKDNPTLYSAVKRKLLDQQQGVTNKEVKLRNSSVSNRARTIKQELKGKDQEEILEILRNYKQKGILTESVIRELKE